MNGSIRIVPRKIPQKGSNSTIQSISWTGEDLFPKFIGGFAIESDWHPNQHYSTPPKINHRWHCWNEFEGWESLGLFLVRIIGWPMCWLSMPILFVILLFWFGDFLSRTRREANADIAYVEKLTNKAYQLNKKRKKVE